jgi:hypothetical protein
VADILAHQTRRWTSQQQAVNPSSPHIGRLEHLAYIETNFLEAAVRELLLLAGASRQASWSAEGRPLRANDSRTA